MSQNTVLRFWISLRGTFSTWIAFTGINKYGKDAVVQISTIFRTIYHVASQRVLEIYVTTSFESITSKIDHIEGLFFENVQNGM